MQVRSWTKTDVAVGIDKFLWAQVNQWDPELGDTEYISKDDLDVAFTKLSLQDFSDCCLAIAYTMKAFEEPSNARSSIMCMNTNN